MPDIKRGTQVTRYIDLSGFDFFANITRLRLIFSQSDKTIVELDTEDNDGSLSYTTERITYRLTQEQTNLFSDKYPLFIEIRWVLPNGNRLDIDHYNLPPVCVGRIFDTMVIT